MATEVPVESKVSVLDELMKDDVEETPSTETPDDEKIIPDNDIDLKSDEDETDEETEDEETEESDKKDEDEEELSLEDKEEDELELIKIPKLKEIKAKYPNILKDFPQLEHALFRNQAYSEVFPTIADAKEAKSSIEEYNGFQSELLDGNIDGVLKSVKAANPKAFDKIAAGIIDSLVRVDANSHLPTTRKITKGVLYQINQLAKQNIKKDPTNKQAQQLEIATELIHDAIFNTSNVDLDAEVQPQREDPERVKFDQERADFEHRRFTEASENVRTKVTNILTTAVTRDIDTKNLLPPYVKGTVVKDVMTELGRQLEQDKPFRLLIDKLWMKSRNENYSGQSQLNIEKALKNKAKSILPDIMKAKKGEALKGLSVKSEKTTKRELSRNTSGENRTPQDKDLTLSRKGNDRLTPRPGESRLDFLMRD